VRVVLHDRSKLAELVEYLRRCNCTVGFRGGQLDVSPRYLPVDARLRFEELELASFLRVWSALNPNAAAELVPDEPRRIAC
jgi:hypothetical protein